MTIAKSLFTRHYFSAAQSDFTTPTAPASDSAVRLKSALVFSRAQQAETREDFHPNTRDALEDIPLNRRCSVSTTAYITGAGTQGQTTDLAPAFATAFTQTITTGTTVAASPAPTTTAFKLAADNLEAGQIGKIDVTDGSGTLIEQRYFYVTGKDESDVLTVAPALSEAPAAGDSVYAVANYNLALINGTAITCYRSNDLVGEMGVGTKFHRFNFRFNQGKAAEVNLEGQCHDVIRSAHGTIATAGGIDNVDTSFDVSLAAIEAGSILSCEDELMLVTAVSGGTLTVSRGYNGTTPASHAKDIAVGPYEPAEETAGAPIRGLQGGLWVDGEFLRAEEASVEIDERTLYPNWLGDEGKPRAAENPENRQVAWTLVCYLDGTAAEKMRMMAANQAVPVFLQAGKDNGRACAFYSPKVVFAVPEIPDAGGELIKVTLESRAVLASSGEDSISFGF